MVLQASQSLVIPEQQFDSWYQTAFVVDSPINGKISIDIVHQLFRYEGETPIPNSLMHRHRIPDFMAYASQLAADGDPSLLNLMSALISKINQVVGPIDPNGPAQTFSEVQSDESESEDSPT